MNATDSNVSPTIISVLEMKWGSPLRTSELMCSKKAHFLHAS